MLYRGTGALGGGSILRYVFSDSQRRCHGLLRLPVTNNPANDFGPTWSPDGSRIAFESDLSGLAEIYTVNPNGSGLTNLTNNPAFDEPPASPGARAPGKDGRRSPASSPCVS